MHEAVFISFPAVIVLYYMTSLLLSRYLAWSVVALIRGDTGREERGGITALRGTDGGGA